MKEVDYYAAADKAIMAMDRENLRAFGRLKLMKDDQLHLIREVNAVYREQAKKAKKRYWEIGIEAYLLALWIMDEDIRKADAQKKAEKAITPEWIDDLMAETDFVTLYRFNTETERKAQRLIEALAATENRNEEIDRALKAWTKQLGQYAINVTDAAVLQAYADNGADWVEWMTQRDHRVCAECHQLDGRVFRLNEVPRKHWNCRCYMIPAEKPEE